MTREEREKAIAFLKDMQECTYDGLEEVRNAIKALEQTIDKENLIEELEESLQKANATNTRLILLVEGKQKHCDDYVSRQAVFETIDNCNKDGLKGIFCSYDDGERFKKYIMNLSPVTPTRKKGKWEYVGDNCFKCSECGEVYTVDQFNHINNYCDNRFPKGCPNCGAEMESEDA